jgi:hypothetical protein
LSEAALYPRNFAYNFCFLELFIPKKRKKEVFCAGRFHLSAGGFSCNVDFLPGGIGIINYISIFEQKI